MLEEMMLSLTSELSSNLEDEDEQDESNSEALDQNKERSVFTSRTVNIGRKLSRLFQYYEQLQDTVNNLLQQQTGGRLVNDVQKAILQLQAECEKLHETTRCLHEDNRQKQSHIEELYKTTEELDEKKADKQMVESEIKADKSVLESKVSRLQFDSATEQLNTMFHELLNKVMGQEQDWHKVIDKLSTEMECKLNRIELDSVKKQLEDRWKSIHERLQAQGAPEHEDAAGIRKTLFYSFYYSYFTEILSFAVSITYQWVFHTLKVKNLRVMLLCRIAELTDYSHLAVSRSCGGSHTVTSSSQRRTGLQYMKHHKEVDIVGLDGHIYKGRLNPAATRNSETKLPTISAKDGTFFTFLLCLFLKRKEAPPHLLYSFVFTASSLSGRDWPVSALGCASQSSISQTSAAGESNSEPLDNQQVGL
uniref:DUF4795 domain-containing protein n=1 Tax=Anabas testudineus TaxID=64144 RepID=A0AAQ6IR89_ANATE